MQQSNQKRYFSKYNQNLHYTSSHPGADGSTMVYSYNTLVAIQYDGELVEQGYWSTTTRKHVNFAAQELGLEIKHYAS